MDGARGVAAGSGGASWAGSTGPRRPRAGARPTALSVVCALMVGGLARAEDAPPPGAPRPPTAWAALRAKLFQQSQWRWGRPGEKRRSDGERRAGAVLLGLSWLAAHQSPGGAWEPAGWHRGLDGQADAPTLAPEELGLGLPIYDVGVTGLAITAFLVAGWDGTGSHPYDEAVRKGLSHLRARQQPDGRFGQATASHEAHRLPEGRNYERGPVLRGRASWTYNHACATLAMVEAAALTGQAETAASAQRAIDYAEAIRTPYSVWGYGEHASPCNTSVTTWMTLALGTARLANVAAGKARAEHPFRLHDDTFEGVRSWLRVKTEPDSGMVGYTSRDQHSSRDVDAAMRYAPAGGAPLAAAGLVLRRLLGERLEAEDAAVRTVRKLPPSAHVPADLVYWHLGALGLHAVGGAAWEPWIARVEDRLIRSQRTDTPQVRVVHGSWDPDDAWGRAGGRVYATALNTLTLTTRLRFEGRGR